MKSPIAFAIVAFSIGISSQAFAQPDPMSGSSGERRTGIGTTSANTSGATPGGTPDESKTDQTDDALYRGKTNDMDTTLLRDEGALHFKTRPREKIQEVDSLKKLQSSGSDPKFQGSLLNSDVSSIGKVNEKAREARNETDDVLQNANESRNETDGVDSRFKTKQLSFAPQKDDEPKKVQSDSSPSPTPSPTISPPAKSSDGSKQ